MSHSNLPGSETRAPSSCKSVGRSRCGAAHWNQEPGCGAPHRCPATSSRWLAVNDDIAPRNVDVVTVAAGYSDHNYGLAALRAEALADLVAIRALLLKAWVVVFGDGTGKRGPDRMTLAVETTTAAAHAACGDANSVWVPISTAPSPWFFGTGHIGAVTGNGNTDNAMATDGCIPPMRAIVSSPNARRKRSAPRSCAGERAADVVPPFARQTGRQRSRRLSISWLSIRRPGFSIR